MITTDILSEECCICLDALNLYNSFLYFDCNHKIHDGCSNLLTNCPLCRSPRIDIAVTINENENENENRGISINQELEASINNSQIQMNDESRFCRLNNYKLVKFLILLGAALFFIVKYLI
jgi:hypothetical protein